VIVDVHCHVWPDGVAQRALAAVSTELRRFGNGTVTSLLETMDRARIDRAVCLGVASTPDRVLGANRFAAALDPTRLVGFGSVHPGLGLEDNLSSLRDSQLRGFKVHPLFQGYGLDDRRLWDILDAAQGEFVVAVHVGLGGPGADRCTPKMLRELAQRFPRLQLIACHFGGFHLLDEAEDLVVGLPNVWLDTSWPPGLATLHPVRIRRIVERHGCDRVLFASDWPMSNPAADLAAVDALGLPDDEAAGIRGGNFARMMGWSSPPAPTI